MEKHQSALESLVLRPYQTMSRSDKGSILGKANNEIWNPWPPIRIMKKNIDKFNLVYSGDIQVIQSYMLNIY